MVNIIKNLAVIRARENLHKKYLKSYEGLIHNTAFIALDNEEKVIASAEFKIRCLQEARIINICIFQEINLVILIEKFINEFLYWNSFIKSILYQ